jgi:hypothetical protein
MKSEQLVRNRQALLQTSYDLVLNPDIKREERQVLLKAEKSLEMGDNMQKVALQLKDGLTPLSFALKLSPQVVNFFGAVEKQYLQVGKAGTILIV